MQLDRGQALAFRLGSQHLSRRLPADGLLRAAGTCGLQNTPPGSAELALLARLEDLTQGEVERRLEAEKTLLQAWSLRAAPYIFPTEDAPVFTEGLLPQEEAEIRHFIYGVEPALDKIALRAVDVLTWTAAALEEVLAGRSMTKDDLGVALAGWVARKLSAVKREQWESQSWYAKEQSLGESVVRFFLPVTALQGKCCHAERAGGKAFIRRRVEWLGTDPATEADIARAELVRRYLHGYGPSSAGHFAEWSGISPQQARAAWEQISGELEVVNFAGRERFLLKQDRAAAESPEGPVGARFLPPHDPYLQMRDRETLILDGSLQRKIWRAAGSPGVVLVEGEAAGMWRAQKAKRLAVEVELFRQVNARMRDEIEGEALRMGPLRGVTEVDVRFVER